MKKNFLYFSILSLLIFSGCGETQQQVELTGESISNGTFDSLIQEYSEDIDSPEVPEESNTSNEESIENNTVETTANETVNTSEQITSISTGETVANGSGEVEVAPTRTRQDWFGVEECNRIIDFNLCVISKAPIENQEAMKESLRKAVEPWKILANTQLREVCQKTTEKETFKEVVNHYKALDDGCEY